MLATSERLASTRHVELRRGEPAGVARAFRAEGVCEQGVRVDRSRIIITQGFTQAPDLLCRVLVNRGATRLAMESPSHPGLWATVRGSGLEPVGCPVDSEGLRPDVLNGLAADAVVVAPAHQFPTGAVMTAPRRAALIEWAATHGTLVIEMTTTQTSATTAPLSAPSKD
jgi:GntR family transcriptional regulator / MocR family aminotransferase